MEDRKEGRRGGQGRTGASQRKGRTAGEERDSRENGGRVGSQRLDVGDEFIPIPSSARVAGVCVWMRAYKCFVRVCGRPYSHAWM